MNVIYHGIPDEMIGTELIPLSQMQGTLADTREKNLEKYKGREEIIERKIPLLDCLWSDVVQFLPLHPKKLFELQRELGLIPNLPPYRYFEIDLSTLEPEKTVVYFKTAPGEENVVVKWLSDVDFTSLQEIPQATKDYYKSLAGTGESPFNYQFVPHIVYRGRLDVADAAIISIG